MAGLCKQNSKKILLWEIFPYVLLICPILKGSFLNVKWTIFELKQSFIFLMFCIYLSLAKSSSVRDHSICDHFRPHLPNYRVLNKECPPNWFTPFRPLNHFLKFLTIRWKKMIKSKLFCIRWECTVIEKGVFWDKKKCKICNSCSCTFTHPII